MVIVAREINKLKKPHKNGHPFLFLHKNIYKDIVVHLRFWYIWHRQLPCRPGSLAQSVRCLTADMCLIADPGVTSSIPARSHTSVEIDHEIISMAILLPSADSRMVVVSYKRKYVHKYWLTA